jgi:hypothetical protein
MKPCWSCGSTLPACKAGCRCAKCVDPIGYKVWKETHPAEYERWLEGQLRSSERDDGPDKEFTGTDRYGFNWEKMDYED